MAWESRLPTSSQRLLLIVEIVNPVDASMSIDVCSDVELTMFERLMDECAALQCRTAYL